MEILINELSLSGQFASTEQFLEDALPEITSLLNEIDCEMNSLYKTYEFYNSLVTPTTNIHNVLIGNNSRIDDRIRKFKSLLSKLFNEPYWEDDRRHSAECEYIFNGHNVTGHSIAEACERDRIVISFKHNCFSTTSLNICAKGINMDIDNLYEGGHYVNTAYKRRVISYKSFFEWNFKKGKLTWLDNEDLFSPTTQIEQGQKVYVEIRTKYRWYLDNLHKNHYEVFNDRGIHLGEANLQGQLDDSKRDRNKTLTI